LFESKLKRQIVRLFIVTHLFVKVTRPGDSEVTISIFVRSWLYRCLFNI